MTRLAFPGGWARRHWFLALLPVLIAVEIAFAHTTDWSRDGVAEGAILFDLCLVVPALYFLCYRGSVAPRPLLIRTAALALAGIYFASKLVPANAQALLTEVIWLRHAGWVALALLELWVLVLTTRLVFGGASVEEIAGKSGAPPWIARLMQIEAAFWKAVWRFIRGR